MEFLVGLCSRLLALLRLRLAIAFINTFCWGLLRLSVRTLHFHCKEVGSTPAEDTLEHCQVVKALAFDANIRGFEPRCSRMLFEWKRD